MSVPATTLPPSGLLDAAAAASGVRRESDERRFHAAKREIVLALERESVLLADRDGRPLCEPGPFGGVLVAFTDEEAGRAWNESRHPAAPDCGRTATAPGLGRKGWLGILSELGASSVAINPSGPLGSAVHADEVDEMRPSLLRRSRAAGPAHAWLDLDARAAERERVRQLLCALEAAAGADDRGAWERLAPELVEANRFGALLVAAQLQVLSGRRRVADGSPEDGLYQMIYGSFAWARFGDPYRATDGLLEAGSLLEAGLGTEPWRADYLSQLASVLRRIRTGYRTREVERLLSEARGER